jgi:DNA-binding MarR family transcriptional regulator
MPSARRPAREAAEAMVAVAPLTSRWIERLLASHEPPLTSAQFVALRAIANEDVSASQLAQRTGVSGPAVSQLLTSLAALALLERHELPDDRRRLSLSLTAYGQRTLRSAHALLGQRLSSLLSELPRAEVDALTRALPWVEAALSGAPPPRRPHPPPLRGPHSPPPQPPRGRRP